jgi:hypothetical protein
VKIILSRKGFDSENGGFASPILPDGDLISLPIPDDSAEVSYSCLHYDNEKTYCSLMKSLNKGRIKVNKKWQTLEESTKCHLDPDIAKNIIKGRADGWRGVFGQIDQAASHLHNQDVEEGDIFLFFGWFKDTIWSDKQLIFKHEDKGRHVLFGYMQVGEIIHPDPDATLQTYPWLRAHPHLCLCKTAMKKATNTLYLAAETLAGVSSKPGYGRFRYSPELVLSKNGETKSKWALPDIFRDTNITYHTKDSWKNRYFQSAHKGQEFVLTASEDIERWVYGIINRNAIE